MEGTNSVALGSSEDHPQENASEKLDTEEPIKVKKVRKKFTDDHLVGTDGLWKIYNDFPHKVKFKGKGHEAEYIRTLMYCYKEWAFRMFPSLAFEDVCTRTKKLGSKKRVRDTLEAIRSAERERFLRQKFGDEYEAVVAARKEEAKEAAETQKSVDSVLPEVIGAIQDRMGPEASIISDSDSSDEDAAPAKTAPPLDEEARKSQELKERIELNRQRALKKLQEAEAARQAHLATVAAPPPQTASAGPEDDALVEEYLRSRQDMEPDFEEFEEDFDAEMEILGEMEAEERAASSKPGVFEKQSMQFPFQRQEDDQTQVPRPASMVSFPDSHNPTNEKESFKTSNSNAAQEESQIIKGSTDNAVNHLESLDSKIEVGGNLMQNVKKGGGENNTQKETEHSEESLFGIGLQHSPQRVTEFTGTLVDETTGTQSAQRETESLSGSMNVQDQMDTVKKTVYEDGNATSITLKKSMEMTDGESGQKRGGLEGPATKKLNEEEGLQRKTQCFNEPVEKGNNSEQLQGDNGNLIETRNEKRSQNCGTVETQKEIETEVLTKSLNGSETEKQT